MRANLYVKCTRKILTILYDLRVLAINHRLKKMFADDELGEDSVIKKYLITANSVKGYNNIPEKHHTGEINNEWQNYF